VAVTVLDSDFNSPDSPMTLTAGHATFVVGVIEQLAESAAVTSIDFAVGTEITEIVDPPYPSDWEILDRVANGEGGIGNFDVLNLSLGAYSCGSEPIRNSGQLDAAAPPGLLTAVSAVIDSGAVIVAAAGNDGLDRPFWPAALGDSPTVGDGVIGVKAFDASLNRAEFSNSLPRDGACALGVDVLSRFPVGDYEYSSGSLARFEGAAIWSGTSFATPHITARYVELLASGMSRDEAVVEVKDGTCVGGE
jgi:hypothetical protein